MVHDRLTDNNGEPYHKITIIDKKHPVLVILSPFGGITQDCSIKQRKKCQLFTALYTLTGISKIEEESKIYKIYVRWIQLQLHQKNTWPYWLNCETNVFHKWVYKTHFIFLNPSNMSLFIKSSSVFKYLVLIIQEKKDLFI